MNEQLLREEIAQKISALHVDKSWSYDVDIVLILDEILTIVRGK
jgi:hypothetical protein